ncbi:hypothetical protein AMS68_001022 [Peltaster fructicola]|uniref:Amidohydrolase-related domain-containing protein n=1 Tax=Peltaster fructicola TaxID=286661 RepID=A0A6H0XLK0_9PEZI|nr:hypothetical protein AMS68_001022 [Peltaster fructicola]
MTSPIMESKDELPRYSRVDELANSRVQCHRRRWRRKRFVVRTIVLLALSYAIYTGWNQRPFEVKLSPTSPTLSVERLQVEYGQCAKLRSVPQDPHGAREKNARFNGAKDVLIQGALVWTGEPTKHSSTHSSSAEDFQWEQLDVLLHNGLISRIAERIPLNTLSSDVQIHNGTGRMLTTGIVDMHTHAGVATLPDTRGGNDDNELSNDITPYVRSLDAINPLDPQIQVIKSGGVTTSLVLPGSGNNMGGEAFVVKHAVGKQNGRPELSAEDMLADPDRTWRYMKMACGENAKRVYGKVGRDFGPFSRMGEAWYFRHAFEQARKLVSAQDEWCAAADKVGVEALTDYLPQDLQWESLGAVLRGQVHVNTHCYTVPDLEAFIRHSNEFKFPVRAFHHAHQTYLVPEILKRNYGGRPPAAALFADNMYYKAESYIGSEQAGVVLYENGITPVYVSDNPVINAQHVVFEAAKAHKYGLPYHVALAGVTSAPAELLGLGERIGKIKEGFDADVTLWDSDPLSVGATPVQVWIDGAAQFEDPVQLIKSPAKPLPGSQPKTAQSESFTVHNSVCFSGITNDVVAAGSGNATVNSFTVHTREDRSIVLLSGMCDPAAKRVELQDGWVVSPATAFGSYLGLEEISAESTTNDGYNSAESYSSAIDGLFLDTKTLKAAFRHGVTKAITAPPFSGGGHKGSSVGFRINAKHALDKNAVWKSAVSVHYTLTDGVKDGKTPSISSAIDELRHKLLAAVHKPSDADTESEELALVVRGELPLVITVHKADTIAALIKLKEGIDHAIRQASGSSSADKLRLVVLGGAESHLLADELAAADIGVVLAPAFPYAVDWEQRRSLTGAPLTNGTAFDVLDAAGVTVAIGTSEDWLTRDYYLMAGTVHANNLRQFSYKKALALISDNIYHILGLSSEVSTDHSAGFVVFDGNPLETQSRVRAVYDGTGDIHVWL